MSGVVAASRKPGSVARDGRPSRAGGHSSGTLVTERLVRPTQELGLAALERSSTWPCSGWGLPCHDRYRPRGGLLLHLFTLTRGAHRDSGSGGLSFCGTFLEVSLTGRYPASCLAEPGLSSRRCSKSTARSPEMRRRAEPTPRAAERTPFYCAANTNGTLTVVLSPEGGNCQPRTRLEMHCERPR